MLQELTINDLRNGMNSLMIWNILKVYNILRQDQDNFRKIKNYYYDDNFCWYPHLLTSKGKNMVVGYDIYGGSPEFPDYDNNEEWKKEIEKIKDLTKLEKKNIKNYLNLILNKLRPEEEWFNTELKPLFDQIKKERLEKAEKMKLEKTEEEKIGNEIAEYIATSKKKEEKQKDTSNDRGYHTIIKKGIYHGYIYSITVDGELAYIGKTVRDIKDRVKEHMECVLNPNIQNYQQSHLYSAMRNCKIGYKFNILCDIPKIGNKELEMIEKSFIENYKPKYNYEGIVVPYRFTEEIE